MNDKDLSKKAEQYKTILENLHEGYLLVDEAGQIYETNAAYCRLTGYTKDELYSMKLSDLRPALTSQAVRKVLHGIVESGSLRFESKHQHKDGAVLDLNVSAAAIDREGKMFIAGMVWDITEEKQAHKKLAHAKKRFQSLFEHNPHSVYSMDLKGNYQSVNSKLEVLSGYTKEELLHLNYAPLIAEEDLERTSQHFQKAAQGSIQSYEITGITKDGQRKALKVTNFPMIVDEEIVGIFGIAEDITKAKEAKQKLKNSEERWYRLVEDSPQGVVITKAGNIKYVNKAGLKLVGCHSHKDVLGLSLIKFIHPEDKELVRQRLERILNNEKLPHYDPKIITQNGDIKYVIVHSVHIKYKGKDAVQSVFHDVTDRKQKEDLLEESLREKEIMLQEIHHRVKNNMAVISGLLELQAMNTTDKKLQGLLKESQMRIRSMAMIHEKLYASPSLAKINFNEYAKELVNIIQEIMDNIRATITVRYRMNSSELNINQAIPCGLVLNELITNCYKHAFNEQPAGTILIGFTKKKETYTLMVEDNGSGTPPGFDVNDSRGLGTTLIRTLSRQLDGTFTIEPTADSGGTCVVITFPDEIPSAEHKFRA